MRCLKNFKFEKDDFWWERLRLEEIGIPKEFAVKYLNPILPDKFFHFLTCYALTCVSSFYIAPWISFCITFLIMVIIWEVIWDGFFRHGFSFKDLVADILGMGLAFLAHVYPELGIQVYVGYALKGFLYMWAFHLFSKQKIEAFLILIFISIAKSEMLTGMYGLYEGMSYVIGASICFWWSLNPKIGQDYEEDLS